MTGHGAKFDRKKEEAIGALLTQRNVEEAARSIGIVPKTLLRWMKEPDFAEDSQAYGAVASGPGAAALARGSIYRELNRQAAGQGYQDIYRLLAWLAVGMFLCAFLLNKNRPGEGAPAGEAG